jgi:hypothetical protein
MELNCITVVKGYAINGGHVGGCCLLQGRRAAAGSSQTSVAQLVEGLRYKAEG